MKQGLLIFFLFLYSVAFAQQEQSWYKQITGAIDKYPFTMHLHRAGHNYYGYYYYQSQQKPIYFNGDDTTEKGKIKLVAFSSPEATETIALSINGSSITGSWQKDETTSSLPLNGKETPAIVPLTFVYTEGERKLRPKVSESPQATFFAGSIWPFGSTPVDAFLKTSLLKIYDQKAAGTEIGKLMLRNRNAFFASYEEDFKEVKTAELKESGYMYTADQSEHILMVYQSAKLASVADFTYIYSGGAHGNHNTNYHVFDLTGRKKLKLSDVLTPAGQKQLSGLLAKAVRSQFKLKPTARLDEVLFENRIAPNQNFYVTGKGIGFCYNPYEIAAYAYGEINLFLSYKDLEAGLQPAFKKLLQ